MPADDQKTVANYEATVSTGLESIARDEVKDKYNIDATTHQGRIWFSSDQPVANLLRLRSICNLYVIIYDKQLEDNEMPANGGDLEPLLMKVGDQCDWKIGLEKWRQIFGHHWELSKLLVKNEDYHAEQPKFRVTCDRHGPRHNFTSTEVASVFGHVVDTKFGWPIKLKDFDLEVLVKFSINHLYVGFTLSEFALDRRNMVSLGYTTLRAATCYALLRVAKIQPGDILIDPMAGSGAIPVECCSSWNEEWLPYTMAGEIESKMVDKCRVNIDSLKGKQPNDIIQLDVTSLPFRDDSVDVFVSDLPFGKRHGSKRHNKVLYPALLREMGRVARLDSGRAVLLTQDFTSMNMANQKNSDLWVQRLCSFVKVGNLNCYIYLFVRNSCGYISKNATVQSVEHLSNSKASNKDETDME